MHRTTRQRTKQPGLMAGPDAQKPAGPQATTSATQQHVVSYTLGSKPGQAQQASRRPPIGQLMARLSIAKPAIDDALFDNVYTEQS